MVTPENMSGIIVEIPDHPKFGHKRKVEIPFLGCNWAKSRIAIRAVCTFYDNVNGAYGDAIIEPAPLIITREFIIDSREDQFVDNRTGEMLKRNSRPTEIDIPEEEREEEGPTTKPGPDEEYWTLGSSEIDLQHVQRYFDYIDNMIKTQPIALSDVLSDYIQQMANTGVFDKVN